MGTLSLAHFALNLIKKTDKQNNSSSLLTVLFNGSILYKEISFLIYFVTKGSNTNKLYSLSNFSSYLWICYLLHNNKLRSSANLEMQLIQYIIAMKNIADIVKRTFLNSHRIACFLNRSTLDESYDSRIMITFIKV